MSPSAAARSGDADAQAALDVYLHRLKQYVGAYAAHLGRLDAIVAALETPLDHGAGAIADSFLTAEEPVSNTTEDEYKAMVVRAKDYIAAGAASPSDDKPNPEAVT